MRRRNSILGKGRTGGDLAHRNLFFFLTGEGNRNPSVLDFADFKDRANESTKSRFFFVSVDAPRTFQLNGSSGYYSPSLYSIDSNKEKDTIVL